MSGCNVPGCDGSYKARGYCDMHYARLRKHGSPDDIFVSKRRCSVEGCQKTHAGRGYCQAHYARWKRWGDPLGGTYPQSVEQRFWSKVDKRGPDECWKWMAARWPDGYGCFWSGLYKGGDHRNGPVLVRAHCWAYDHLIRVPRNGLQVLHRCDNPPCCNPAHLFFGTQAENIYDMIRKGRNRGGKGSRNRHAKLSEQKVAEIRARVTGRYGEVAALAREYGVTTATMSKIIRRDTWA